MSLAYNKQLGLKTQKTDVRVWKTDKSLLKTHRKIIAVLQVTDKLSRACFFQKTFLFADVSMKLDFGMLFLTLSNANV